MTNVPGWDDRRIEREGGAAYLEAQRKEREKLEREAAERDEAALEILDDLLPEDSPAREALYAAQRDAIGRDDPDFQVHALAAARARVAAQQQEKLAELERALSSKRSRSRVP